MGDVVYDIDIEIGECSIIQNDKKYVGKITSVWRDSYRYPVSYPVDINVVDVEEVI